MAGYFKKRRRASSGPGKNEQKVLRRKELESQQRAAGGFGGPFPSGQRFLLQLVFLTPQQQTLDQQTRVSDSSQPYDLRVSCPGRCGVGSFNLEAKVDEVVATHQTSSESLGTCQEPLYGSSTDLCGCKLRCKIEVVFA